MPKPPVLRLRPWRYSDTDAFIPRADFAEEMALHDGMVPVAAYLDGGRVWTLYRPGGPVVGVAGLYHAGLGFWQAWAWLAELSPREIVYCLRLARKSMRLVALNHNPAGFQAHARMGSRAAVRTLERLGFVDHGLTLTAEGLGLSYHVMIREH